MEEMAEKEKVRIAKVEKKQREVHKRVQEKRRRIEARLAANLEMAKKVSLREEEEGGGSGRVWAENKKPIGL